MDTDSIPRSIFFIVSLIIIGGFFSGSETAFSNCSRIRLLSWSEDGRKSAGRALRILDKFDKAIITLLIGGNIIHVVAASLAAILSISLVGEIYGSVLATVIMTLLIFIFSETIPKHIAKVRADEWACFFSFPLELLMLVLTPLSLFFTGLSKFLRFLLRTEDDGPSMTGDDFQTMIATIEDEGGLETEESELIQSAVEFSDRTVAEILTPRVHITGIPAQAEPEQLFSLILNEKHSRLPVYEGDLDHIIGVLNTKQYLQKCLEDRSKKPDIRTLMMEPYFIPKSTELHGLVDSMRRSGQHLAIVQDKWGGTEGMVTLEDLLEELVGDIWDEDETQEGETAQ